MKAEDIMTHEVVTIPGFATVEEAVKLMKEKGLRSLIVEPRNETDRYGMIETDVVYQVVVHGFDPKQMQVYQIMTIEKPKPLFIEDRIDVAREEARAICKEQGRTSPACAAAWKAVEELQLIAADRRAKQK